MLTKTAFIRMYFKMYSKNRNIVNSFLFYYILKCNLFQWWQRWNQRPLLQSSVSHDPSEIIQICWFGAQLLLVSKNCHKNKKCFLSTIVCILEWFSICMTLNSTVMTAKNFNLPSQKFITFYHILITFNLSFYYIFLSQYYNFYCIFNKKCSHGEQKRLISKKKS